MIDLDYLRHLRERNETLFDRCLFSALLEAAGFKNPTLNGDEIWHHCPKRRRLTILRGEEAALSVLAHWPRVDLALERLTGKPSRIGVETFQHVLRATRRQTQGAFQSMVKGYHIRFSSTELQAMADQLLDRAGALMIDHLRNTGRSYTVARGPYG